MQKMGRDWRGGLSHPGFFRIDFGLDFRFWIAGGGKPTRVRKTFTASGLALSSLSVSPWLRLLSIRASQCFFLFRLAPRQGFVLPIFGRSRRRLQGRWRRVNGPGCKISLGNFAGMVSPALTGFVVQRTGHFFWAFAATAVVLLGGAMSWAFVVGPVEPVQWESKRFVTAPDASARLRNGRSRYGLCHLPVSAERKTASITAMLPIASSMETGTSPSPRTAREKTSP